MKSSKLFTILLAGMLAAGCASKKAVQTKPSTAGAVSQTIITPATSLKARVASYNATGRFVVLSFPVGQMPEMNQAFFLYRAGLKVGEIKVTGPQRDNNTIADLVTGEAQVGDEVRDQ
jgi:hypothetical protein